MKLNLLLTNDTALLIYIHHQILTFCTIVASYLVMKAVVIRFIVGLFRQYKKLLLSSIRLKLSDLPQKAIRSRNYSYEVRHSSYLKKNAVTRQTVNCPNTTIRRLVYDYREPTEHRKIIRYKGSFEVFGFATIYTSENLL